MNDKLIRALRLAVDACENSNHRTHHTLQQQCRFLDGLRAALLPALEEAEKQQAAGASFEPTRKLAVPVPETWPAWAHWIALDPSSHWVFYEQKPETTGAGRIPAGGLWGKPRASGWPELQDWNVYIFRRTDFHPDKSADCPAKEA